MTHESWADETKAELSRRHDNKYQLSLLDSISTQLVNISQQLADIHNQFGFTLTRYKNPLDNMEEEDNEVVTAGIDISKSVIQQQESQVTELQLKNSIIKNNLSDNYENFNNALIAVA
ncbi:17777_t:CDS:2 [Funneliformis geosporum]|nr:17777_t:CDS:2 [Funneliformis geosporum]